MAKKKAGQRSGRPKSVGGAKKHVALRAHPAEEAFWRRACMAQPPIDFSVWARQSLTLAAEARLNERFVQ